MTKRESSVVGERYLGCTGAVRWRAYGCVRNHASELRPEPRLLGLAPRFETAVAGPGPTQPVHGGPWLPAAHQQLAQSKHRTVWSFRPPPDQIRVRPARPGPAGSSVTPGGAGQPKCRSLRAERDPVFKEGWVPQGRPLEAVRSRAPGAWANLVLLLIHAHHSDHRSAMMVTAIRRGVAPPSVS